MTTTTKPESVPVAPTTDLAALRAEQKRLAELIKAAKAAEPRRDRLATENEREINKSWRGSLAAAYKRRINAGQSSTDAINAILAASRAALEAIALPEPTN